MKNIFVAATISILVFFTEGCSAPKSINMLPLITGKSWNVNSLTGKVPDAASFPMGLPSLNFGADGKLTGSTGCNNFNGNFNLSKSSLSLDPGAMTRKFCGGSGENDFISALKQVTSVNSEGNMLKLMGGGKELMSLVPSN